MTYVVVGIKHACDVLGKVTITNGLHVVTAVDYKIQPSAQV